MKTIYLALLLISYSLNSQAQERVQDKGTPNTQLIINNDTLNKSDENGELQGKWERTHTDGSFKCKGVYKDGYWERKWPNGNWRYQINMSDGYRNGYCKFFYQNGKLKSEGNYEMGKEEGLIVTYFENGNKESEENFKNGILNGDCKYYDEKTNLLRRYFFRK